MAWKFILNSGVSFHVTDTRLNDAMGGDRIMKRMPKWVQVATIVAALVLVALAIALGSPGCDGSRYMGSEYVPDQEEAWSWEDTCLALHAEEKSVLYDVVDRGPVKGDFERATNLLHTYDISIGCWPGDEVVYEFSPPRSGYYRITLQPEFDGGLFVLRADCRTSPYTLNFSDSQGTGGEELVISLLSWGETYFIVVEETASGPSRQFKLAMSYEEQICHGDNPCAEGLECVAGRCEEAYQSCSNHAECDDNEWCTYDYCGSDRFCHHDTRATCGEGVACIYDSDCADLTSNPCTMYGCGTQWAKDGRCHFNDAPDGWLCDDGWDWSHGDHCSLGECVFEYSDAS